MLYFARWKVTLILAICLFGVIYAAPNVMPRNILDQDLPGWLPTQQINLGLDLQGGSHLLLEVDVDAVVEERLGSVVETVRSVLRPERIGYLDLGTRGPESVGFRLREPERAQEVVDLLNEADPELGVELQDDGAILLSLDEQEMAERRRAVVSQSIEIVRRRIDETGTREPVIQRQGDNRIIVQLPGIDDPARIKSLLGQTAQLSFHIVRDTVPGSQRPSPEPGTMVVPGSEGGQNLNYIINRRVEVSGDRLVDAQPTFQDAQPVVSFRFDTLGATRFGEATQQNTGRRLAIVLDDEVISAPVIREPILGGQGIISGSFTPQGAQDLSLLLRAGALPAPLNVLEERTVGPGLGADSIAAGKMASLIGIVLVVGFMIAVYGLFGLFANIALFFNLTLVVALLSLLQATLTLPGIAGIVLTIGMAVDANVIIFERMREEAAQGRKPVSAVDAGYGQALRSIIDANVTTLIAAAILFQFGSGPVRGFAVTLGIGILTSMFTAIWVTRLLVVWWLRRRRPQALPI